MTQTELLQRLEQTSRELGALEIEKLKYPTMRSRRWRGNAKELRARIDLLRGRVRELSRWIENGMHE